MQAKTPAVSRGFFLYLIVGAGPGPGAGAPGGGVGAPGGGTVPGAGAPGICAGCGGAGWTVTSVGWMVAALAMFASEETATVIPTLMSLNLSGSNMNGCGGSVGF